MDAQGRAGLALDGTPAALGPIAHEVLAWVAKMRVEDFDAAHGAPIFRQIELCALATLDIAHLQNLYAVLPKGE